MKKNGTKFLVKSFMCLFLLTACQESTKNVKTNKMVYQNSTINALAEGLYQGDLTFGHLKKYGDFGLGTFQNLDGEMIAFDGVFYQVKSDGSILEVKEEQMTPFSVVTTFSPDKEMELNEAKNYETLKKLLDSMLPSPNYIYAFRIDGTFTDVVTRSVPETKNGTRLVDVIPEQSIFEYEGTINGTMVGFYFPPYMRDINVVGYHFHFLSDDKLKGGHLLDLNSEKVTIEISYIHNFQMIIPQLEEFKNLDLMQVKESELDTIEKK